MLLLAISQERWTHYTIMLIRNLLYHWRGNLAVLLGVAVGTAVLAGALFVGDSLRGSLRDLASSRLDWVDQALVANRFFHQGIAEELTANEEGEQPTRIAPAIMLRGTAAHQSRPVGNVTVLGVEARFWPQSQPGSRAVQTDSRLWDSDDSIVALNAGLAKDLRARVGDRITLFVQTTANVPRESLLGRRKVEDALKPLAVTVREILPDHGIGGFALKPTSESTRNAFVPVAFLQKQLELGERVNVLLASNVDPGLQEELEQQLTLADWGLRRRTPTDRAKAFVKYLEPRSMDGTVRRVRWLGRVPDELAKQADPDGVLTTEQFIAYYRQHRPYISLESKQMYLEPAIAAAAEQAAKKTGLRATPTLIHLADTIKDTRGNEIPYAVVAALPADKNPPVGPSLLPPDARPLGDGEIILADWDESPLVAGPGDKVTVEYYSPDDQGRLILESREFTVRARLPIAGAADDPDLTPEFPGITDKLDMSSWENPPFPYKPSRIKTADDNFWKRYRTTPKAYVSLEAGQKLWSSRFGNITSLRLVAEKDGTAQSDLREAADLFANNLLLALEPAQGGFVFLPVRADGMAAGGGNIDFGGLFIGFSFFLIASALLLVGLLVRLNTERRAAEIGLLLASGLRRQMIRGMLLREGTALAVVGSIVGLVGAAAYAWFLLAYLRSQWPGGLPALHLYVTPLSCLIGFAGGVAVSVLTIVWALRILGRVSPRGLLSGETEQANVVAGKRGPFVPVLVSLCLLGAVGCLIGGFYATGHEAKAGTFFGSGALLLTALLALVTRWLRSQKPTGTVARSLTSLAVRNAARQPVRSLLTLGLLASATFLLVAVQVFHKQADEGFYNRNGGSGGFRLVAEPTVAVFQDLNDADVHEQLIVQIEDELLKRDAKLRADPNKLDKMLDEKEALLKGTTFHGLRVRAGDNTSCLNLYRPGQPRIMGVPRSLTRRGGFQFAATLPGSEDNPWLLLERPAKDAAIPIFADANSAMWVLHKGLGDTIDVTDGNGVPRKLQIVGLLQGSIFQSELLMGDADFKQLYPREEGFRFFLIDCPPANVDAVQDTLQIALADHGFIADLAAARLQSFLDVENTYLATFQALGAFGLLLGAMGLAVVLLRSIWERRGELALMRALGFRRGALGWLVLAENAWLLTLGLAIGVISAMLSVAPHLLEAGAIDWLQLGLILLGVLTVGMLAGTAAVAATLRAPLLPALRRE